MGLISQHPENKTQKMKVILLTPMEIEAEKVQNALQRFPSLQNDYQIVISGVGRETTAKAMMHSLRTICVY